MSLRKILFFWLFVAGGVQQAQAGQFDLGLGISGIDNPTEDAFELAWDVQAGYEFKEYKAWNFGAQIQYSRGLIAESEVDDEIDLAFTSTGLYTTARPNNWWLQFKAGVVRVDYKTMTKDSTDTGAGVGVGIVIGDENFRFHLIDYQRMFVGGESFDMYTISIGVLR
jgi:hypothetical protein